MSIIKATGVTKRFGGLTAVSTFSLDIPEKSIASLIGPNGAGKTTFFNCVTGFYTPDEGTILFQDKPIQGLSPDKVAQLGITRTYQNIRLFKRLSALDNILVGEHVRLHAGWIGAILRPPAVAKEERDALVRAKELLDFVGLNGKGDTHAENLAYGDQRRLEIARALASDPKVLLLDEPTAGMNPSETTGMIAFIRRLRDELDLTIFLIEHDMKVVMNISDQVTVLDYGLKISEGTPEHVQNDPIVIEAYLGTAMEDINKQKAG